MEKQTCFHENSSEFSLSLFLNHVDNENKKDINLKFWWLENLKFLFDNVKSNMFNSKNKATQSLWSYLRIK